MPKAWTSVRPRGFPESRKRRPMASSIRSGIEWPAPEPPIATVVPSAIREAASSAVTTGLSSTGDIASPALEDGTPLFEECARAFTAVVAGGDGCVTGRFQTKTIVDTAVFARIHAFEDAGGSHRRICQDAGE